MSLNGRLENCKMGGCKEIRQPFANPLPTLCQPFANPLPTLRQPFANLFCQPLSNPLFPWTPGTRFETRVNSVLGREKQKRALVAGSRAYPCASQALIEEARCHNSRAFFLGRTKQTRTPLCWALVGPHAEANPQTWCLRILQKQCLKLGKIKWGVFGRGGSQITLVTRIAATSNRKSLATAIATQKNNCDSENPSNIAISLRFLREKLAISKL